MKNKLFMIWFLESCGISRDVIRWAILSFLDYKKLLIMLNREQIMYKIRDYVIYHNIYGLKEIVYPIDISDGNSIPSRNIDCTVYEIYDLITECLPWEDKHFP